MTGGVGKEEQKDSSEGAGGVYERVMKGVGDGKVARMGVLRVGPWVA